MRGTIMRATADYDAVVVGSGIGGLVAAVALARAGQQVCVFEQAPAFGGWCHAFELRGHRFDTGVHYVGQLQPGGRLRQLFEGLGVAGDLAFAELSPAGLDHVDVQGERYELCRGAEQIAEGLAARFQRDAEGIREVVDIFVRIATEAMRLRSWPTHLSAGAIRDAPLLAQWAARSLQELLASKIDDPRARTVLAARCGDHGLPPSRASVALHALVTSHYFDGAWYPLGGSQAIADALVAELRRNGGDVHVSSPVERILVDERAHAVGVSLANGRTVRAHRVVSDADPAITWGQLVPDEHVPSSIRKRLRRARFSTSCVSLFAAAELDPAALGLDSGNVWSFEQPSLEPLFTAGIDPPLARLERFPGHFLTVTSLKDRTQQKGRVHTVEAFAFAPWSAFSQWADSPPDARPPSYHALKDHVKDALVRTVERTIPGFRQRLVFAEVGTPLTNRSWVAATEGNLYGIEKTMVQMGPLGFRARTGIEGLFLCGASLGAMGVLGAGWSGLSAAALVLGSRPHDLLRAGEASLRLVRADDPSSWPEDLRARVAA
jgi:phytoene dehydrogenase-like protein